MACAENKHVWHFRVTKCILLRYKILPNELYLEFSWQWYTCIAKQMNMFMLESTNILYTCNYKEKKIDKES